MKNNILSVTLLLICFINANAQSPHAARLYGMTQYGGTSSKGSIFHYTPSTNDFTTDYEFQIKVKGKTPKCEIVTGRNGKYYGTTTAGGAYNAGVLFSWDSVTSVYNNLYDFTGSDGKDARGGMLLYNDKLYGTTNEGGANNYGVIYEYDIAANNYTKKIDLDSSNGKNPTGSLTMLNNMFYGFTSSGGVHDKGVLFEWNPATNVYTKKFDFDSIKGSNPIGKLTPYNGKMYAMCNKGGASDSGTIYQWDYTGNTVTKTFDFNNTNGASPMGYLTLYNNKFYGMTYEGGIYQTSPLITGLFYHYGIIFEYNPANNAFLKKKDLGFQGGNRGPLGSLTLKGNVFYGTTSEGIYGTDGIFSWNPVTNVVADIYSFRTYTSTACEIAQSSIGTLPFESLFLSGNFLLGSSSEGTENQFGCIYKFSPDSVQITDVVSMGATDGSYPKGSLTKVGHKLYGLTYQGGNSHAGNIFEWDLHTQQFTERLHFDGYATGIWPKGSLTWYNGKFYGINTYGKSYAQSGFGNWGTRAPGDYFSWDPATNAYQSLLSANYARATPVLFNNKLYTTTEVSSGSPGGAITVYNPSTNTLTDVAYLPVNSGTFNNYQDRVSANGVTYYNGKFYGMTPAKYNSGATPLRGTIYEWDTTTTVMAHKYDFVDSLGTYPTGNLLLVNNEFYGLTSNTGNFTGSYPSLFKWNPATNVFQKMKAWFSEYAYGTPTYSGGKIYFLTEGSQLNVFEYDPILDTTINVHSEPISLFGVGGGWNFGTCVPSPSYQQLLEVIPNEAPVLVNSPSEQNICVNKTDSTTFTITDTDLDSMHFQINSSNNGLLPVSNISISNVGNLYTITYFGNINQTGTSNISLAANDGYGDSVSFSFPVNITSTGSCSVIPVTWLSFTGVLQIGKTILNWSVASEENNKEFIIERSTDGIHWRTLFALASRGNTSSQSNYSAIDHKPITGINFYRIKQLDNDNSFTYSAMLSVKVEKDKASFFVYPNPAHDILNYEWRNGLARKKINVQLFGTDGKLIKQFSVNNTRGSFSVHDLTAGIYMLTIKDMAGIVENKKIIVQK